MTRVSCVVGSALVAAVTMVAGAAAAVPVAEGASSGKDRLAALLMRLDPGARVGGNTQVSTVPGAVVVGVGRRPNFVMGLASRQRIVGGQGHDELGARGAGTHIRGGRGHDLIHGMRGGQQLVGGPGDDHIFGGRGDDRLDGGPGHDRLVDRQGATVVVTGRGKNRVDVADGEGDELVLCSAGSVNRIRADRGDRLHPRCRRGRSIVHYVSTTQPRGYAAASDDLGRPRAQAASCYPNDKSLCPLTGDGSNTTPYASPCDVEFSAECTVTFAARSLTGLWANEYVPAYGCSPTSPDLNTTNYAPGGTALPEGVQVYGLGNIGVSITGTGDFNYVGGMYGGATSGANTLTGSPYSSATNWTTGTNSYYVVLHCE